MKKRMPKGSENFEKYRVTWAELNYWSGGQISQSKYYADKETAEMALEIAKTHKTKIAPHIVEWKECPDSKAEQEAKFRDSGANWDGYLGCYLYSARY